MESPQRPSAEREVIERFSSHGPDLGQPVIKQRWREGARSTQFEQPEQAGWKEQSEAKSARPAGNYDSRLMDLVLAAVAGLKQGEFDTGISK